MQVCKPQPQLSMKHDFYCYDLSLSAAVELKNVKRGLGTESRRREWTSGVEKRQISMHAEMQCPAQNILSVLFFRTFSPVGWCSPQQSSLVFLRLLASFKPWFKVDLFRTASRTMVFHTPLGTLFWHWFCMWALFICSLSDERILCKSLFTWP